MEKVRTLLKNRERASDREKAGQTVYATEEILGSLEPVKDFVKLYRKRKVDLELIEAAFLLDYCRGTFTPEEKKAYEAGLSVWLQFMEACVNDFDNYTKEAQKKNSLTSN